MIITKSITKYFDSFQALQDISFEINKGEIVGFVGKNGAGKTTLMRILTSYLSPSSGTVMIDGEDLQTHSLSIRQKIGYLPENPPLYMEMTVQDYLKFAAQIKNVPAPRVHIQLDKVLEECQLKDVRSKTIRTLSKGYKQRVGIAQAIVHEPKLLILDEPTSGLDPIQNLQIRNLIKNLKDERTVILSTHILSEIEQIAKRVLIIKSGRIIVDDALDHILGRTQADSSKRLSLEEYFVKCHSQSEDAHE